MVRGARDLLLVAALIGSAPAAWAAPRKSGRDWAKMTEEDWRRIEEEMEDPEDKAERDAAIQKAQQKAQQPSIDMAALNAAKSEEERQAIMRKAAAAQSTPGKGQAMGYVFVTVKFDGCCPEDRKAITELGRKWSSMLSATGMGTGASVWKDDQLALQTQHENHVKEVTDFMMLQPEVALVRHDMENTYGPAADAEWIAEYEAKVAKREADKQAKIDKNRAAADKQRKKKEAKEAKAKRKQERKERRAAEAAESAQAEEATEDVAEAKATDAKVRDEL
jgi:hypothetical protein